MMIIIVITSILSLVLFGARDGRSTPPDGVVLRQGPSRCFHHSHSLLFTNTTGVCEKTLLQKMIALEI